MNEKRKKISEIIKEVIDENADMFLGEPEVSLLLEEKIKVFLAGAKSEVVQLHIWEIRKEKGITLRELADKSGISKTHINNLENGATLPTLDVICRLAYALGIPPETLYDCKVGIVSNDD